ncbi:helix-hairpin-helix domain-containing protein [Selenomonas sp.]|uniref:helix-hairpin-helix domain-containing protein n=1 Tax=Selenomonas sp. TaxID=2053611 RepID=UPI002A766ABB|nr:helix-hairpin-helix domain-containing protein [Selenomonas sp.]MDY3296927.1 helix-hairpin-helix domain-containing protein [Selenomonas sp.]MDY4415247.1 helix-hairpin-helix domain-containing protein [Selenomonas sp.]
MPMFRKSMIVLLLLALVAGGGALYGMKSTEDATVLDAGAKQAMSSSAREAQEDSITVYVTGAVNQPGVVSVAAGARVADAVNACGGLLPTADAEKINMAQAVKDGQQIRVPEKGAAKAAKNATATASSSDNGKARASTDSDADAGELVNINTADEAELDKLPGVGPSTAQKIIEYRETEGQFASPEDIMKVKGIGKAKYEKMKDRITV